MQKITLIKPQKNKKRVNIYLDNKFGFGLDLENYMKLGLKVEQELSDTEIAEILKKAEFQKTSDKILRFATLRPRSRKEVETWFYKYKVHKSLQKDLFNKLKRLELLDDTKFAKWWVEQRLQFRPRGIRALSSELFQKGIDRNIIEMVLQETEIDELKLAKKLIEKKLNSWKRLDEIKAKKKMSGFLASKGIGWEVISEIVRENFS